MKNLKMFAVAVMAFAVMAMGVHAATAIDFAVDGGTAHHYDDFNTGFNSEKTALADASSVVITLQDDVTLPYNVNFGTRDYADLTSIKIDLNGHVLTLGTNTIVVNAGQTVTVVGTKEGSKITAGNPTSGLFNVAKDGKLDVNVIEVDAATATAVKFADGNTEATLAGAATTDGKASWKVADIVDAAALSSTNVKGATLTLKGSFEVTSDVKVVNGLNVTVEADIKNNGMVLTVTEGIANIKSGLLEGNSQYGTVGLQGASNGKKAELHIAGGVITNKKDDAYALVIGNTDAKWDITGGQFNSGKDVADIDDNTKTKYLPAINLVGDHMVEDSDAYKNNAGVISGGEFLTAIVGDTKAGAATIYASDVLSHLVKEGLTVTEKEGTYNSKTVTYKVLGASTSADEPGTTEPGDSTIPPVPQTNDNILVYAGLGLVSLASVAFTTRKRED